MRDRKYYIALDDFERRVVVNCLILPFPMKKKSQKSVYGDRGTYGTLNTTERLYISIC